jgi:hypothetical protein
VFGEREKDAGAVDEEVVTVEPQLKKMLAADDW